MSSNCSQPIYTSEGWAVTLNLVVITILFPILVTCSILFFQYHKAESIFTRKRSTQYILISTFGAMLNWFSSPFYDLIGSQYFPCALFLFCSYMCTPLIIAPIVIRLLKYYNQVAGILLKQSGSITIVGQNEVEVESKTCIPPFIAHIRVVLGNRDRSNRLRSAKFARSKNFVFFWLTIFCAPYLLGFFGRLGYYPIVNCTGCQLDEFDIKFLLSIIVLSGLLLILCNPVRLMKKDHLKIMLECILAFGIGVVGGAIALVLMLVDPDQLFQQQIFNWRLLTLIPFSLIILDQTVLQVVLARKSKKKLAFATKNINQEDRFRTVLEDRELKNSLRKYLTRELSDEILAFMDAVDMFKEHFEHRGEQLAESIFELYIQRKSPHEINISSSLREKLLQARKNVRKEMFDEAYNNLKQNLIQDGFARFLQKMKMIQNEISRLSSSEPRLISS